MSINANPLKHIFRLCHIKYLLFTILLMFIRQVMLDSFSECNSTNLKYDFTECDAFGGKWRVMVPESPEHCHGSLSYIPTRVKNCYTSCESGEFFNKSSLLCENCASGHYSLSGGIVYDNFKNPLPTGFNIMTESKDQIMNNRCYDWHVDNFTGDLISIIKMKNENTRSGCVSAITYTAKVVKRGRLRFTYHYKTPNDMPLSLLFTFNYRLYDGMGVIDDDIDTNIKFPMTTIEKTFETIDLQLTTPGLYIFTWKSIVIKNFRNYFGFSSVNNFFNFDDDYDNNIFTKDKSYGSISFKNQFSNIAIIRITKIIIEGVAYASECTPCEPGTYAPGPGMKECLLCPENTAFNGSGAIKCLNCDPITEYASKGSSHCSKRPICGVNDFYSIPKQSCNEHTLKQEMEFKWIEPRICVDSNNLFPKQNSFINCSPLNITTDCDLGMELRDKVCQFCPDGYYRDVNMTHCLPCPLATNPYYVLSIYNWNTSLPAWSADQSSPSDLSFAEENDFFNNQFFLNSYFSRECFRSNENLNYPGQSVEESNIAEENDGCTTRVSWQPFNDYIRTGASAPLDAYLVLSLTVPWFRTNNGSELIFHFELNCEDQCLFLFVETKSDESDLRIQDLYEKDFNTKPISISSNKKKYFPFSQQTTNEVIKEWSQSTNSFYQHKIDRNTSVTYSWIFKRSNSFQSFAKIKSLLLIGSAVGSAISCQKCPLLSKLSAQCISCPNGKYLEINQTKLLSNRSEVLKDNSLIPNYQCKNCPTNHILNSTVGLSFGIESCIPCGENLISDNETNICYSNCLVTFNQNQYNLSDLHQPIIYKGINLFTSGGTQYMNLFKITLCGHRKHASLSTCLNNITVFSDDSSGVRSYICRSTIIPDGSKIFAAQSASLGDELLQITQRSTFANISVHKDFISSPEANKFDKDFHLYFKTSSPTSACPLGRTLTITMRCMPGRENVKTPNTCPDGTCNGCDFHLLIETGTAAACHLCRSYSDDFETVIGECIDGLQQVHYLNPKGCIVKQANETKFVLNRACSILIPKQVRIGIGLSLAVGLLLLMLVFHFWNKNRSLEYKYTKLIENSAEGKGTDELTLDNCCVEDDDDDEDVNDAGQYTNYVQLSFDKDKAAEIKLNRNSLQNKKLNNNHHHHHHHHNNRIDKKNDIKLVESQEMQQLFSDAKDEDNGQSSSRRTIDEDGYETIHLISPGELSTSSLSSNLNPTI